MPQPPFVEKKTDHKHKKFAPGTVLPPRVFSMSAMQARMLQNFYLKKLSLHEKHKTEVMKRQLLFLSVIMLAACGRTFEQRTSKYAEVGPVSDNRAAVLDINEGVGRWGYVDGAGRLAVECRYAGAGKFSDGLAAVQEIEGLWGYIDTAGRTVVAPQYTVAGEFDGGMAWVQAGGERWGRIDNTGKVVIPCLYTEIGEPDQRGWMRVRRDGKWGCLRETGEVAVPCAYDRIGEPNAYGLIPVTNEGKHGFLDSEGREALPCFFSYISEFKDGYARTNYGGSMALRDEPYGGQWGLIDTLGRETIPCRYYDLAAPGEGLAAFRLEQFGNYGYVDVKGNVAISPRFAVARPFSNGVAVVSYNNVNFGLVDRNGSEISSFRYKRIGKFNDGLAPFNTDLYGMNFQGMEPRCGYIDTEGREVLPAKWDDAAEFSEMRAAVMRFGIDSEDFYDARWGYIATNGQLVVPFKYHEAYPFSCGLARVFVKGLGYGYIDRKGEEVVPCKYQEAEDFHDFRARVKQYDRVLIIDDKGRIVNDEGA